MVMDVIQKLKLKISNIEFFPATNISQIEFTGAMLKNDAFAPIPSEYAEFLKVCNGFASGILEFYGTEIVDRKNLSYKFPNIVKANDIFKKTTNPLMLNCVLLGNFSANPIIYDNNNKIYKIVLRLNFEPLKEFKTFTEVLEYCQENI